MFKLLILQQLYNISDDEDLEYQVNDRLSFMAFLGSEFGRYHPGCDTRGYSSQHLTDAGLIEALFERFDGYLRTHGYQAKRGQILDATIVPVPRQHISKEEKEQTRQRRNSPRLAGENPHRMSQRDLDASWTKKNQTSYFGYKDHISVDVEYGFVRNYSVTDAAVHDSQALGDILDVDNEGDGVWADSAYRSAVIEAVLSASGLVL